MSGDTTSIDDLPIDNNNTQNIKLDIPDTTYNANVGSIQPQQQQLTSTVSTDSRPPDPMSQKTMNEVISGINEAQQLGLTQLPSKDIPMNQNAITSDNQTTANYLPQQNQQADYIGDVDTTQQLLQQANNQQQNQDRLEYLYQEFQIPILISILYFIFQLPIINNILLKNLPKLFNTDGNIKVGGILCKTAMFGLMYYIINKSMIHLSTI